PRAYSSGISEGGIGCDTNTMFSAHVSSTGCPIFIMNDNALTSCCGVSYLTSSRTTIRFSGSYAISTICLLILDFLTASAIGCWLRGFPGSTQPETSSLSAGRILPAYGFGSNLVTHDKASACFHAAFSVVIQLVLPSVYFSRADVETWFLFALLAEIRVDYNEWFRVFVEAH